MRTGLSASQRVALPCCCDDPLSCRGGHAGFFDRGFPVGPHTIFRGASGSKDFFREPLSRWYLWLLTRCCLTIFGIPQTTTADPWPNNSSLEWCMRITRRGCGGMGFCRRARPAGMERRNGLHDLSALHLWRRQALPNDVGLQPQAEAAAAG